MNEEPKMENPLEPSSSLEPPVAKEKKKKKPRLSYKEKLAILELLDSGMKQSTIATKFNISTAAITYLKSNKEHLLRNKEVLEQEHITLNRKRFSHVITSDREKKLMEWFTQNQAAGVPISCKRLQEAATVFNESCNGPNNFKGGKGFIYKFQKRHSIGSLNTQGERLLAKSDGTAELKKQFLSFVNDYGYELDQIYNADECALLWKSLPEQTPINSIKKNVPDWKLLKDKVTLMVCANADGSHRLPLYMIGNSSAPSCLTGLNNELLPIMYSHQHNAWMDKDGFMKWFTEMFIPQITSYHKDSGKKCLLILDNASSHPSAEYLNSISDVCSVVYLSPNVTSLVQPMNQGVIEQLKRLYRRNMLRAMLMVDSLEPIETFSKEMNLYKCIMFAADAWNSITQHDLANAWCKALGQSLITNFPEEDDGVKDVLDNMHMIPQLQKITYEDIESWFTHDNAYPGWEVITPEGMINPHGIVKFEDLNEEADNEEHEFHSAPTNSEAVKIGEAFEKWCFTQWIFTEQQLSVLREMVSAANDIAYNEKFCC